jgi:nicotinate-nucleotide pyrophosphorylase (carboxylating)
MLIKMVPFLDDLIRGALKEDLGKGDLTGKAVVPASKRARARIVAKQDMFLCGMDVARRVFRLRDKRVRFRARAKEGEFIRSGREIAVIDGPGRSLLECERVALNFLQQLSGIATLTRRYVKAVGRRKARIMATRKTHPGLRGLEKYAVVIGGGLPHRLRLDDGILIKDNHIALTGSIKGAVRGARMKNPRGLKIEVEVNNLKQFREALEGGADIIMLDNMSLAQMRKAAGIANKFALQASLRSARTERIETKVSRTERVLIEASGGISLAKVKNVAGTGVDYISVGALTHSAPAMDITMKVEPADG